MDNFADAFGAIQVTGQLVRIELMSVDIRAQANDKGQRPLIPTGQLIVPLDGFVRSFGAMNEIMQKLVEAGAVKMARPMSPSDVAAEKQTSVQSLADEGDKEKPKASKKIRH